MALLAWGLVAALYLCGLLLLQGLNLVTEAAYKARGWRFTRSPLHDYLLWPITAVRLAAEIARERHRDA